MNFNLYKKQEIFVDVFKKGATFLAGPKLIMIKDKLDFCPGSGSVVVLTRTDVSVFLSRSGPLGRRPLVVCSAWRFGRAAPCWWSGAAQGGWSAKGA